MNKLATETCVDYKINSKANEIVASLEDKSWLLFGGEAIPSGADLNNYYTCGTYHASNNAIARSLTNKPTSSAFVLYVYDALGNADNSATYMYRVQEVRNYLGHRMMRYATSSSGVSGLVWNAWLVLDYFDSQSITVSGNSAVSFEAPILVRRFGSIVTITYGGNLTVNSGYTNRQITLGTLNSQFRPTYASQVCSGNTVISNSFAEAFRWMVNTSGTIMFWSAHQGIQEARCTITYII